VNTNKHKNRRPTRRRPNQNLSIFQRMTPDQSRQARAIAFKAALAVIG
jgi:hypothetical protein